MIRRFLCDSGWDFLFRRFFIHKIIFNGFIERLQDLSTSDNLGGNITLKEVTMPFSLIKKIF